MKTLNTFIKESEESDLLLWQLDQWFKQYENEKQEFIDIIISCINDHNTNNLENYIDQTYYFKNNYKSFVSFILDDINLTQNKEIDYIYNLKQIINQIINNKSSKNKYNKKEA